MPARRRRALALLLLCAAAPAQGRPLKVGALIIDGAWTRATPPGVTVAAGYVSVTNTGTTPEALTGGSIEGAAGEPHTMAMTGGVMTMRPSGPLTIPPGGTLTLSPAGQHLMISGLTHPLARGGTAEGTLTFAQAGPVQVRFRIEAVGAHGPSPAPGGTAMPGMDMR